MSAFLGFPTETFRFLAGLVHNNERDWFAAHKAEYERFVVEPALALITDLDPVVSAVSTRYRGVAKKVGGSLMRIYRDTRFGHDKTPYKTNIGIQFRHEFAADVHAPGWYVHIDLEECFVGAGTWHPEPADLLRIRQAVAGRPEAYTKALAMAGGAELVPAGDSTKRVPKGFEASHPLITEIHRKDFLVSANLTHELFGSPALVDVLAAKFQASSAYMAFLCGALDAGF
jgi:uncharacterized protein (TIGR02453 family)